MSFKALNVDQKLYIEDALKECIQAGTSQKINGPGIDISRVGNINDLKNFIFCVFEKQQLINTDGCPNRESLRRFIEIAASGEEINRIVKECISQKSNNTATE